MKDSEKAKDPNYMLNPTTGRWVKKDGVIGKKLLASVLSTIEQPKIPVRIKKEEYKFLLIQHQSFYYTHRRNCDLHSSKLAMFDLDGTIIKTISGLTFPQSETDWQLTYDNVIETLNNYHINGYKIIIVSNQLNVNMETFTKKIENIQKLINLPIEFYIATEKDSYRKPMTDMWDFMLEQNHLSSNQQMLHQSSFYCGDAAGRPKNYLPNHSADFNITDRYFAHNIGLSFYTPEEIFLKMNAFKYNDPYQTELNLNLFYPSTPFDIPKTLTTKNKNLIIMVGPPASGKTTLSKHQIYSNYIYLNNDTIKNKTKLDKYFVDAIQKNNNVIIDNTNPKLETRQYYIDLAHRQSYKIYCYFFDLPKILIKHLNQMRVQITHGLVKAIPMVGIHTYYKNLVKPTLSEGYNEIINITKLHQPINNIDQFNRYYPYHYDIS